MYNEELKLKYLSVISSSAEKSRATTIFLASESMELECECDLSQFDLQKTVQLLESTNYFDLQTIRNFISTVNKYRAWCNSDHLNISKTHLNFSQIIANNLFENEIALINELKTSIEFDQGYFVVPAICLVWLGVDPSEIGFLPKANIDLNKGIIKDLNGSIVVSEMPDEIKSVLTTFATTYVGVRTQNRTFEVYPKDEGQFLYRMITKNSNKVFKPITRKNISVEVVILRDRITANTGSSKLSIYNVEKSGILNRVYKLEKSGVDVFASVAREQVQALFKNKGDIFDNLFLYRKYKEAFNLE